LDRVINWLSHHHVDSRGFELARLLVLIAALELAAAAGLAYASGPSRVANVLSGFRWQWLGLAIGALLVSFIGYYFTYRDLYRGEQQPPLPRRALAAVVVASFGGFHGGAALDRYALQAVGFNEMESRVRAKALGGLEQGVLALGTSAVAICALMLGARYPALGFSLPWAVCPLPGFVIAFVLAEKLCPALFGASGWRRPVAVFFESVGLIRHFFLHPRRHAGALLGMALFWAAELVALWASLAAFGLQTQIAALVVGYASGMLFTRRSGPLGGAGVLMLVLPLTLAACGLPLATALAGVFVYRLLTFWPPVPCALAGRRTLQRLISPSADRAHATPRSALAPGPIEDVAGGRPRAPEPVRPGPV
jgi:uncharacterized membrane protein YbhN (UPF0104 family)